MMMSFDADCEGLRMEVRLDPDGYAEVMITQEGPVVMDRQDVSRMIGFWKSVMTAMNSLSQEDRR